MTQTRLRNELKPLTESCPCHKHPLHCPCYNSGSLRVGPCSVCSGVHKSTSRHRRGEEETVHQLLRMETAPTSPVSRPRFLHGVSLPACKRFRVTRTDGLLPGSPHQAGREARPPPACSSRARREGLISCTATLRPRFHLLDSAPGPRAWPMPLAHTPHPAEPTEAGSQRAVLTWQRGQPGQSGSPTHSATRQEKAGVGSLPKRLSQVTPPRGGWAETIQPEKGLKNITLFFLSF